MAIILRSQVDVIGHGLILGGKPAVMDLHDDDRFVLIRFDPRTGEFGERLFDTSVANVSVSGTSTYLTISDGRSKRRVDFSGGSPIGIAGFGLIGYAVQSGYASQSGIRSWVEIFRQRGVLRRYSNTSRNLVVLLAILGGLIALGIVIVVIARAVGHGVGVLGLDTRDALRRATRPPDSDAATRL